MAESPRCSYALVGYVEDLGITNRWLVIHGDAEFFAILKRVHNRIHGSSDRASLGDAEADHYRRDLSANAVELLQQIRPGDIVLLHDPQSAGLAAPLAEAGAELTPTPASVRPRNAVDQHGQVIDALVSARRDAQAARRFFTRALRTLKVIKHRLRPMRI